MITHPSTTATPVDETLDYRNNPWTLVYRDALEVNAPGAVNIQPARYSVDGIEVAANVYLPAGFDTSRRTPAIAVAHPNGGVKEQVAGHYAQRLAELGYVTIAADASFQGASGGEPRQTDKPANRVEDVHGMADHLETFPGVDAARLGLLGICGGGGYAIKAAQADKRFITVATVSLFNSGRVRRNGLHDTQTDSVQERLRQASDARRQQALGGRVQYVGDTPPTAEQLAQLPPRGLYRQGFDYYGLTHAHPRASGRYTTSSLLDLMSFDAADEIALLDQPLLMIAGSDADTKYMTDEIFEAAVTTDKTRHIIDGATHIETYWVPAYVDEAVAQLTTFLDRTL